MSRGLGQTELLDAPKPRRLIVRQDATCWWGVDPSSVRVAIASVTASGTRCVSLTGFPRAETGPRRLGAVYQETWRAAHDLAFECGLLPGVIAVEQPSGQTPNPMLLYATGAILAALRQACNAEIVMVTSSGWKALACGHGQLRKPKAPCAPEDYPVLRWARSAGYEGSSWDAADAWGVAEWARRTFELEQR